jgi:hypothetical protein
MTISSLHGTRALASPATLVLAFIAGALAVPVFHQVFYLVLHLAGVLPTAPYQMTPTKPLGVPALLSISFWGGVWGVVFALTVRRWFDGAAYWVASFIAGGIALTLVALFIAAPLKTGQLPAAAGRFFGIGFLLNAAWGIGWALFLALFERLRGGPG